MKFVQTLLAFALASAAGSAAAVGPSYLGNLAGNTVSIGNNFMPGATINDVYSFDIMPLSAVAGTAVSIELNLPSFPGAEFSISNFKIEFRDSLNNLIAQDTPTAPNDYTLDLNALLPAAMGYQFVVSGNVTGTLGGSYGGALAAAPVPEAETYAMMLAGLGLVGFMVSRRRSSAAV
ncbi:MAG: FxDxF family PEP-CTERM protein [Pseudomonadota bacterium]|jgi:hypothetical protein